MNDLDLELMTADAAFVSDDLGCIVSWNEAAERLLGFRAAEAIGRPCHEVVCGTDLFGNRICGEDCPLRAMARRREPIHRLEMIVRRGSAEPIRVAISVLTLSARRSGHFRMVHLIHPITREEEIGDLVRHLLDADHAVFAPSGPDGQPGRTGETKYLTPRETEVLRLLANGGGTREIATRLQISTATVRTHVESILHKLDVRSRLAAVTQALREHLI